MAGASIIEAVWASGNREPLKPRMPKEFLRAEWQYLAMINYEIDPRVLAPCAPRGTEIDSWGGKTFVSMVGFLFLRTRVMGLPIPFHEDFEEVNLRFYVRRVSGEEVRRGVVFVKEIVPRTAIALMARGLYNEKYVCMPMRHTIEEESDALRRGGAVEYGWRFRRRWNHLSVGTVGAAQVITPGSQEEFITEHYWGYSSQRDGGTKEYRVEHPSWRVRQVSEHSLDCDVAELYGPEFVDSLRATPASAFLAEGSPVVVYKGLRI